MYFNLNANGPILNPFFTPRPLYTPIMTQMPFNSFFPPLYQPVFAPTQNFNNNSPFPKTPFNNFSPPRYKPIMTEPSNNLRRPMLNQFDPLLLKNNQNNQIKLNSPKRIQNVPNSFNIPFTIDYSTKLGEGPYSNVYCGTYFPGNIEVAIKMSKKISFYNYVSNEIKIYNKINGLNGIPKIYWAGKYNNHDIIVYQKLGKSLQKDFYDRNKTYDREKIERVGIEALNILESIHSKNIVHGDIKPICFHFENNYNNKLYLIDFGFASEFYNSFTGQHIQFKENVISLADNKFCSRNISKFNQKSRRDDIESLGYILIFLFKSFLPWESPIGKDKKDLSTSLDLNFVCYGLNDNIKEFIKYSWNLSFEEKPNYNYLRNLLNENVPGFSIALNNINF